MKTVCLLERAGDLETAYPLALGPLPTLGVTGNRAFNYSGPHVSREALPAL